MIGKRDKFRGGFEKKQSALELGAEVTLQSVFHQFKIGKGLKSSTRKTGLKYVRIYLDLHLDLCIFKYQIV